MTMIRSLILIALLVAAPVRADEAGDLVFAERGPWSLTAPLVWELSQTGPEVAGFVPLGKGSITLTGITDPGDGKPALELAEASTRITRKIGPFPVTGGDPVLTFFLETVSRDMAALTGGSPFYIRNRLKDALFRGGQVTREGDQTIASFEPFRDDRNSQRMLGFETLMLRFTLDDPHQPIRRMRAETGALAGGKPAYVNEMVLK